MDPRTSRKMTMIGANMPREFLRNMVVKERPFAETRARLEAAASDKRISSSDREQIRKALGDERVARTLDREVARIDPNKQDEARKYIDAKVDRYIAQHGKADMRDYNSFMSKVNK